MTVAGTSLAVVGVIAYAFLPYQTYEALIIGVGLGAAVVLAGHLGGGPQPVPRGGYSFEQAMALLWRATVGGLVVAGTLVAIGFILWTLEGTGPMGILFLFAASLAVLYLSVISAVGLVHVSHITSREDPAAEPEARPEETLEPGP